MMTTKGEIADSTLLQEVEREKIPCGYSVTTKYLLNGEIVRQDVTIEVDPRFMMSAFTRG